MNGKLLTQFIALAALITANISTLATDKEIISTAQHHQNSPELYVESSIKEVHEGNIYCGGGQIKRQIEFVILESTSDQWNARVTVNGNTVRAMTAYSYFGNYAKPKYFVVALLAEDRGEFLLFKDDQSDWLEYGDYTYRKCN